MSASSWIPTWAIVDRDLRKYFRSPGVLFVSLFLPLLQLVIIGYAFGGKVRNLSVALVDLDRSAESLRVRQKLDAVEANARTFKVHPREDLQRALTDTADGRMNAVLVIPEDYSRRVRRRDRPQLGLILDNTDPFVVSTLREKMSEMVQALNAGDVAVRYRRLVGLEFVETFPYVEYIQYLLPGAITMAIFFCALIGGGVAYIDDKVRGIHEAYLVTPISNWQLLLGMHLAGVIKGCFAGLVVTIVGMLIAGMASAITPSRILLLLGFSVLVSTALSSMVSVLMVRVDDPMIPRLVVGILNTILFFPSGAVYPISSFPRWLQLISTIDPFTYAIRGFRAILLKNVGLTAIFGDALVLALVSLFCFAGVLLLFRRGL